MLLARARSVLALSTVITTVGCTTIEVEPDAEFRVNPSPGCFNPQLADGVIEMPAGFSVANRYYEVDIPPNWNGTDPIDIVYFFHACGGDETAAAFTTLYIPMYNLGTGESAIVVTGASAGTCWDIGPTGEDVEFIARLRQEIENAYCVDLDEIHHGGVSSGAFAANGFGCRYPTTSIYAVSGGIHHSEGLSDIYGMDPTEPPTAEDCSNPVPTVLMHGVNDPVVGFEENAIPARDAWLDINGCTDEASPFEFGVDLCDGAPQPCSCVIYDQCTTGAPVVWCVHDGGHLWVPSLRDGASLWYGTWDEPATWPDEGGTTTYDPTASSGAGASTGDDGSTSEDASTGGEASTGEATTGAASTGVDPTTGGGSTGEDPTTGGSTGGGTGGGEPGGCDVVLAADAFDTLDTSRWFVFEQGGGNVSVDGGELVASIPSNGGRAFLRTNATYDLDDFAATIEIVDLPPDLTAADIRIEIVDSSWAWVALKTAWGNLQARGPSGNIMLAPYDAEAFRFWRIRTLDGSMFFEVSADGEVWDLFAEIANPLSGLASVTLRFQPQGGSPAGEVRLDNFLVGQGCPE